ncbi:GAP family protein [Nonomuraea jiangxiensis]|uniref:Sap, sulfolipid-1-addressing protein n=1 Tax=Nonomuraea jiangxiensis TaxID=633440 RepID=A0A1G8I1X1_9ACTN|nr:GAP family protein [Nonomuraea jiangxiensis]SDI12956.1 Sap, sulfolipid-1-addressing protein [Nonomuraea jiangxiensis]
MTVALLIGLIVLALLDSTSIGTLLIPVFLMLAAGRPIVGKVLVYLITIVVFYFAVGVALMLGLRPMLDTLGDSLDSPVGYWIELIVGVALFLFSFRFDPKRRAKQGRSSDASATIERIERSQKSVWGMVVLGLTAGAIELVTMLPYLGAIGLMATEGLSPVEWVPTLALYNVVMVLPALLLLLLRLAARGRAERLLQRIGAYLSRHCVAFLGWVLAIVGFLLARDGFARLFLFD